MNGFMNQQHLRRPKDWIIIWYNLNSFSFWRQRLNLPHYQKLINVQNFNQGVTEVFKTLAYLQLGYKASELYRSNSNIIYIFQVEPESGCFVKTRRRRLRSRSRGRVTGAAVKWGPGPGHPEHWDKYRDVRRGDFHLYDVSSLFQLDFKKIRLMIVDKNQTSSFE